MRKLILVGLIVMLLAGIMGCGKPEAEEGSYEDFVAEYYQTKLANTLLQNKCDKLEAEFERLKGRDAEYVNAVSTLAGENEALRIEVAFSRALGESRSTEFEVALNELVSLRAEKQVWARLYKTDYDSLMGRYNKLNALYPPVHFDDKNELVKWRANLGDRVGCLELQDLAFGDGYIVSVSPDLTYCVVVAGDYLYKITPEDKELVEKIRKVE